VSDGGSSIATYTATAFASASSSTPVSGCSTSAESCSIGGLSNSVTYFVSVTAANAAGTGEASSPRVAVMPLAKPGAPSFTALTAGNTYLSAAFTAGTAGSAPISGYEYQLNGGSWLPASGMTSPLTTPGSPTARRTRSACVL
jgi:titin